MAMDLFSKSPRSFKMDRKSTLASNLKSSISRKLLEFIGNYTDDVLAEYITVLVCNGKHQYQAKDDLEAFLGERSAEFVTWLWNVLSKYASYRQMTTGLANSKDLRVTRSHDIDADQDQRRNRLRELQDQGTGNVISSLIIDGKLCDQSTSACERMCFNDKEILEGGHHCPNLSAAVNEVSTWKASSLSHRGKLTREFGASGHTTDDFQTYEYPTVGSSFMIKSGQNQSARCSDISKKVANIRSNRLPSQLSSLPERESPYGEISHPVLSAADNVSGKSLSPRAIGAVFRQNEKSRGSVWDRLGKPQENTYVEVHTSNAHGVDSIKQNVEANDEYNFLSSVPNDDCRKSMMLGASRLGKRSGNNDTCGEYKIVEHGASQMSQLHAANNIRRKRHFGEIITGSGTSSVSLVHEKRVDLHSKEYLRDLKRSSLAKQASEATVPNAVSGWSLMAPNAESNEKVTTVKLKPTQSQVLDVKQRLCQIETEVSKLREKQADMKKYGKSNLSRSSGALKKPEEDIEARTVLVTNVHFAATKEALASYFMQCGLVHNVVVLTDHVTAQPKGSAYIIFASRESVDKAAELSGTSFFSRTIKVLKKAEAAAMTSAQAQLAKKPVRVQNIVNRKAPLERQINVKPRLQWHRESASGPSEPSASTDIEEKPVDTPSSMQDQL